MKSPLYVQKNFPEARFLPITDLMLLIRQDVDRTIPEVAFFQSEKIRTMMCNILFIHAKIDPGLCYKQGMHEILGRCPTFFLE